MRSIRCLAAGKVARTGSRAARAQRMQACIDSYRSPQAILRRRDDRPGPSTTRPHRQGPQRPCRPCWHACKASGMPEGLERLSRRFKRVLPSICVPAAIAEAGVRRREIRNLADHPMACAMTSPSHQNLRAQPKRAETTACNRVTSGATPETHR